MGILSTPILVSRECFEISRLVSWFPQEIILLKLLMGERSRLVSRLLLQTMVSKAWLFERSSSVRLFRPQISTSKRRLADRSREVSSLLVISRYLKAVFDERSIPLRGFSVMVRESRLINASRPVRSEMPHRGYGQKLPGWNSRIRQTG
jgi:hypothetical protein